jgi:predicted anti-sigma-YlaC factor YlaD
MHPDFESLSRFALREATVAEAGEVEAHLRDCPACRKEAREIALLELGLRQAAGDREPATPCPDALQWAAYADGTLPAGARAALEQHLLNCDDCLHRVLLAHRTRDGQVPERLMDQARRLRDASTPAVKPVPWISAPLPLPRWAALGVSVAIAALVVLLLRAPRTPAPLPITPASQQTKTGTDQQQLWQQLAALKPENGRVSFLAVTPALRDSISAYQKKPDREQQLRLLDELQKLEPTLPAREIQSVQWKGAAGGKTGDWVVLQWKESRLDLLPIPTSEPPRREP